MSNTDFAKARLNMVDSQILPNRVTDDHVIRAMGALPRESFLPTAAHSLAYADKSVLIEDGRYLMQPMVLARLLDIAEIGKSDVALAIGCASGYGIAVLARLVDTVVAIEPNSSMRVKAERNLAALVIDNVVIVAGEFRDGNAQEAPFDLIFIDGAVPEVPDAVAWQLSDGGRLVAIEMPSDKPVGRGILMTRYGDAFSKREVFDAVEHVLPGFEKEAAFSF